MTPEAQRIAIAEACGYKNIMKGGYVYEVEEDGLKFSNPLPDYLSDLNAMHEAENFLIDHGLNWELYLDNLHKVCGNVSEKTVHATAAQRSEAFLRTLGLWKD